MKLRIERQRAVQVVKNITHIHEQITKAKRIPAAKSLNFTHISGNVFSSTPASSNTVGYVVTTKGIRKTIVKQKQQAHNPRMTFEIKIQRQLNTWLWSVTITQILQTTNGIL